MSWFLALSDAAATILFLICLGHFMQDFWFGRGERFYSFTASLASLMAVLDVAVRSLEHLNKALK